MSKVNYHQILKSMQKQLSKALENGWSIDNQILTAPANHRATIHHWAAEYDQVAFKDTIVNVPHWFWDEF